MNKLIKTWLAARHDPAEGELTTKSHGDYDGRYVEHGWWLTPSDWGLGVGADRERWRGRTRRGLVVRVGIFSWTIDYYPNGRIR